MTQNDIYDLLGWMVSPETSVFSWWRTTRKV